MPAIMMADPGRQGPGPGESKGVYGHFGSPADEHQREAEHLRRMQVTYASHDSSYNRFSYVKLEGKICHRGGGYFLICFFFF